MALFASISWLRSAQILSTEILATTMKDIALIILRLSLSFLNLRDWLLLLTLTKTELPYTQILPMDNMTGKSSDFVGAIIDVNCNELNSCDIVTKKNTQICGLSVLGAVCYTEWVLVNPIVASCANIINIFASCYV